MKCIILSALVAAAAWAQPTATNQCVNANSCSLPVTTGNLVLVKVSGQATAGTITNSQGITLTARGAGSTYRSHDTILSGKATATENLTIASTLTEGLIALATFPGYDDALAGSAAAPLAEQTAMCPTSAPLSVTPAADALAISTWVEDSGHANACTGSSGAAVTPGICPNLTGLLSQWNWAAAPAGSAATQTWTISPGWNAGTRNCGLYAFAKTAAPPPPPTLPVIASFTATPASINPGQYSSLVWSVTGATSISIDHGLGVQVGITSTIVVSPSASTTYTLTATGPGGNSTATATVTMTPPSVATMDRASILQLLGITTGQGLESIDDGAHLAIYQPVYTSHCIPQASSTVWTITAAQHGRTDDGLTVVTYDDQAPRNHIEAAGWSFDPSTLTVTVRFAQPQAGCVVIR